MVLFVCETYAQLFNAINIKLHMNQREKADICFCDTGNKFSDIIIKLKEEKIFENVYIYYEKYDNRQSLFAKLQKAVSNIFLMKKLKNKLQNAQAVYEKIYISGPSISCVGLYYLFKHNNSKIELCLYEEGIFEYYIFQCKKNTIRRIYSKIVFGEYYLDNCKSLYVYNTNLALGVPPSIKLDQIPRISYNNCRFKNILNRIFKYNNEINRCFQGKDILIVEQAFPIEIENIRQKKIFMEIIKMFGGERIVIKLHPNSPMEKYDDLNVKCIKTTYSLELIQMNIQKKDMLVISICSSAIFNYFLMFNEFQNIILLYKMFNSISVDENLLQFIEKFKDIYPSEKIMIPKDLDTIKAIKRGKNSSDVFK